MNKEFFRRTIQVWQPLSEDRLTEEDAREIVENLTGFFSLLEEWDQKHEEGQKKA
jgi:hypothetical protein